MSVDHKDVINLVADSQARSRGYPQSRLLEEMGNSGRLDSVT